MRNQKVIFLRGLIASGKTTWAKAWVAEDRNNRYRANKDDLRKDYPESKEKEIVQEETARVKMALLNGKDVVIDDTNFNPIHEERFRTLANHVALINGNTIEFEIKEFDIDPITAIERDSKRESPIGKKAIIDMYKKYIYKNPKGFKVTGNVVLCDIDGTIAFKHEDRDIYNYTKVKDDYFNGILGTILAIMNQAGYRIVFLSGREDNCRKETEEWLDEKFNGAFMPYTLLMRKAGDRRPDTEVKKEIFEANFTKEEILLSIDDRPCMTRLWKDLGIYTLSANQEKWNLEF